MKLFGDQRRKDFLREALPHRDALYRMALSLTSNSSLAQDLVQDTYKEAWRSFDRYQPGTRCKAWLFTILFRVGKRLDRIEGRHRTVPLDEVPEQQLTSRPDVEETDQEILTIVAGLPEHYRVVLVLADVESLSYREISEAAAIPIGTVMSRLNRARKLLRERLEHQEGGARSA